MSTTSLIAFLVFVLIIMLVIAVIEGSLWLSCAFYDIEDKLKNPVKWKAARNERRAEQKAREAYYRDNFSIYSDRSDEAYKEKKIHDREENIKNGRVGLSKLGVVIVGSLLGGLVELCPWLAIPCIIVFFIGVCA